jgi:low affinity Fe/Cu permease
MNGPFRRFAARTSELSGTAAAFLLAVALIIVWAATGPIFHFSDTWQLVINTSTTIITFLMVFVIQNTQNRDAKAIHLKLDELLKGVKGARTQFVDLEDMSDEEIEQLRKEFKHLREKIEQRRGQVSQQSSHRPPEADPDEPPRA